MKVIIFQIALSAIALVLLANCQPIAGGELEPTVTSQTILLDTAARSCYSIWGGDGAEDVSSLYMSIPSITVTNPTGGTLTIAYVEVTLTSSNISGQNGSKTVTIGGDQLLFAWDTAGASLDVPPLTTARNDCAFKIGGIAMKDKTQYTVGTGRVYVYGLIDEGNNSFRPANGITYFSWIWNGQPL